MAIARVATTYTCVARVAISFVTIPRVAHDKLHETCMFHAMRKRGPAKHVMGLKFYRVATRVHTCKNEVIIEQYRIFAKVYSAKILHYTVLISANK